MVVGILWRGVEEGSRDKVDKGFKLGWSGTEVTRSRGLEASMSAIGDYLELGGR